MLKRSLAVLVAAMIIFTISSFTAVAMELPDFEKWSIHKTLSCKKSDGSSVDFKMKEWWYDEDGTQKLAQVTQISTGATFIIFMAGRGETYTYKNRQQVVDVKNFFEELESTFSKDDFAMILTSCTGSFLF
ncbi:MAG: hypothetical protein HZC03_00100 [Candidatus Lloydbacteria bacterium]|nr:hypothetical protein [Candidatus Lloydbacteria bacterium]